MPLISPELVAPEHGVLWHFYQRTIGQADGDRCPMSPSCSAYAEQAIREHGWIIGWMMTFDRFGHETTEAQRKVNGVRYRDGRMKAIDEVVQNDFWWTGSKTITLSQLMRRGETQLSTCISNLPSQLMATSDETLRQAGKMLLKIGAPDQAAIVHVTLWSRSTNTTDALFGALSFLEAGKPDTCNALLDKALASRNVNRDDQVIVHFAQGLAYRKLELYDAAAEAFEKARELAADESITDAARMYFIEANLKGDKWIEAAMQTEEIGSSSAKEIKSEMLADLPWRSPALAGMMSMVVPGTGQVYCGRYQEGFWAFILCSVFACASYEAFDHELAWVGTATTFIGLSWYSGNIYGAISAAHKYNKHEKYKRISNWIERLEVRQDQQVLKVLLGFQF